MVTPLSVYGTLVPSTTTGLTTSACSLATTTGGTGGNNFVKIGTAKNFIELVSLGSTVSPANGPTTMPSPTGNGWVLDGTLLEGQTLVSGSFGGSIRLSTSISGVSIVCDIHLIAAKYNQNTGAFTTIGEVKLTGQTINNTATVFTLTSATLGPVSFAVGERLYIGGWVNITNPSSNNNVGLNVTISTTSSGIAGRVEMDTAGYTATLSLSASVREKFYTRVSLTGESGGLFSAHTSLKGNARERFLVGFTFTYTLLGSVQATFIITRIPRVSDTFSTGCDGVDVFIQNLG